MLGIRVCLSDAHILIRNIHFFSFLILLIIQTSVIDAQYKQKDRSQTQTRTQTQIETT